MTTPLVMLVDDEVPFVETMTKRLQPLVVRRHWKPWINTAMWMW
jgi:hypothetical protein